MIKYKKPYTGSIKVGKQFKPLICSVRLKDVLPGYSSLAALPYEIERWLATHIKEHTEYYQGSDIIIEFISFTDAALFELTWG